VTISVVAALVLLGGSIARLDGRRLMHELEAPAFPERWLAYRARLGMLGVLLVAAMVFGVSTQLWSVGLALTAGALLVAHYPVRRAAYQETWGLFLYVATAARWGAALFGGWILLAVTPQVILVVPDHRILAALVLALLVLGSVWYRREVFLFLVGATPLVPRPDGLARVLARADLDAPVEVYRAGVTGGLSASAFALPSAHGHAVVIGDTLVEALDPDALTAIIAREVARLERWTRRRIPGRPGIAGALALVAIASGLGVAQLRPELARLVSAAWGTAVVAGLTIWILARYRDTDSDVRAAALGRDAEALVRALVTLYSLRRMPRRLSPVSEEAWMHPSLARRIQVIRRVAGVAPAALTTPVVLVSSEPGRVVILDAERAHWLDGVEDDVPHDPDTLRRFARSARLVPYRQLTDLRLVTGVRGVTWLHATHRSGRSWRTPVRARDVAAAQAALDVVDERLSAEPTVTRRRAALLAFFAAAAAASAAYHVGVSPVVVLAAIVLARPRQAPPWLVGVLIVASAIQEIVAPTTGVPPFVAPLMAAILGVGTIVFVIGPAVRRPAALLPAPRDAILVAGALVGFALAVGSGLLWVARAAAASIPHWRIEAIALSLMTAAIVMAPGRAWPRGIAAATSAALGGVVFGLGAVGLAAWAPLASGTPLVVREAPATASRVLVLDQSARRLALSPSGRRYAVRVGRLRASEPYDVIVGRFGGEQQKLAAYDVSFVDDATALLIARADAGSELTTLPLESSDVVEPPGRPIALPPVHEPRLSADASSGIWTIAGWHPEEGDAVTASGRIGQEALSVKRWVIPGQDENAYFFYLPVLDAAFSVTRAQLVRGPALLSRLAGVDEQRWQLWKLDGKSGVVLAMTAAALECLDPLPGDETLLCLARHADHTVIWSVAGRTGRITQIGRTGHVSLARLRPDHLRLLMADGTILRVSRAGGPATRSLPAVEPGPVIGLDSTEGRFATLSRAPANVRLSLYDAR
jgi:hypothetical protein